MSKEFSLLSQLGNTNKSSMVKEKKSLIAYAERSVIVEGNKIDIKIPRRVVNSFDADKTTKSNHTEYDFKQLLRAYRGIKNWN